MTYCLNLNRSKGRSTLRMYRLQRGIDACRICSTHSYTFVLFQSFCWVIIALQLLYRGVRAASAAYRSPQAFLPSSLASRHPADTVAKRQNLVISSALALYLTDQVSLVRVTASRCHFTVPR